MPAKKKQAVAFYASAVAIDALPADAQLSAFKCGHCTATFATNKLSAPAAAGVEVASTEPMCPSCGSQDTGPAEGVSVEDLPKIEGSHLASMTCHGCNVNLVMSNSTVAELDGSLNCLVCAAQLQWDTEATAAEDDEEEEEIEFDDADGEEEEAAADDEDAEDDESEDDEDEEEARNKALADDSDEAPADTDLQDLDNDGDTDVDDLFLLESLEATASADAPLVARFIRTKDSIVAFLGEHAVAVLNKAEVASARQDAYELPTYIKALTASVQTHGLAQTLEDFGFRKLSVKVDSKALASLAQSKVEARAVEIASEQTAQVASEFRACMAIASQGLNKNFWNGEHGVNKLKAALASELKAAGMTKGAERLLDRVFAANADLYNQALLAQASELMSQPVELRNAVANAISGANYKSGFVAQAAEDEDEDFDFEDEDEDDNEEASVEARFAQPVRAHVASHDAAPSQGSKPVSSTIAALRGVHGRLFPDV